MLYNIILFFIRKTRITPFKNIIKLIGISLILMGFFSSAHALSQEERAVNKLLFERKFDEAYELLNNYNFNNRTTYEQFVYYSAFHQYNGYLLGSGVLSSGKDLCGAINHLEKAYRHWKFISHDLNFLYGKDWAPIAAMEGNPNALFDMGQRTYTMKSPWVVSYDRTLAIKEAYKYFYNAGELGHSQAKWYANAFIKKYPNIDFLKYKVKIKFREILCPVRDTKNLKQILFSWQDFEYIDLKNASDF